MYEVMHVHMVCVWIYVFMGTHKYVLCMWACMYVFMDNNFVTVDSQKSINSQKYGKTSTLTSETSINKFTFKVQISSSRQSTYYHYVKYSKPDKHGKKTLLMIIKTREPAAMATITFATSVSGDGDVRQCPAGEYLHLTDGRIRHSVASADDRWRHRLHYVTRLGGTAQRADARWFPVRHLTDCTSLTYLIGACTTMGRWWRREDIVYRIWTNTNANFSNVHNLLESPPYPSSLRLSVH